jgi:hypothetical protein
MVGRVPQLEELVLGRHDVLNQSFFLCVGVLFFWVA